eukprot:TRINITY_DN17766_c0_g1_i2.p1 TRINITY_DN17766_c0_g1~~TRINITY_DN17766_c0_g1_i2.p1  ORF type:complete len:320 (+),score=25.77 TRINITY_DN17766_c0_g1_i2:486-1445(+)
MHCELRQLTRSISSCGKRHQWTKALQQLHASEKAAVESDVTLYGVILTALSQAQQWKSACHTWDYLWTRYIEVDTIGYGSLARLCQSVGAWRRACLDMVSMTALAVVPNIIVCNHLMGALQARAVWQKTIGILDDVLQAFIRPNSCSGNTCLSSCLGAGARDAWRMSLQTTASVAEIDTVTLNTRLQLQLSGSKWRAMLFLCRAASCGIALQPNIASYSTVLASLDASGWERASGVLQYLRQISLRLDVVAFNAAAAGRRAHSDVSEMGRLESSGAPGHRWLRAFAAVEVLVGCGLTPSSGSFNVAAAVQRLCVPTSKV